MAQPHHFFSHDATISSKTDSTGSNLQMIDGLTNREGIQMTITKLILLVMAVFVVVFAFRVFGSRFLKK